MPEIPTLPPIADQPLTVVLLAHNDAEHLDEVVNSWASWLDGLKREHEILLVDDGSDDRTAPLLARLTDRHRRLRVLRHAEHRGDGAALRTALATARYPLLCYALCDPRYRPGDTRRLLKDIDRVHLVGGYRGGGKVPAFWRGIGLLRRVMSRIIFGYANPPLPGWLGWRRHLGRCAAHLLFGVAYHDVTCPFRLMRRSIFAHLPIQSDSSFVHVEILAKANFLGFLLGEEVPLGDHHHPVYPDDVPREPLGRFLADGRRLLRHPDFEAKKTTC